jgi:hypothetical protein
MAGRALLLRAEPGFSLPAYERFAPPPPPALVAARLEAGSGPGDIVVDLFGRGGWIARSAIDSQRKAVSLETTALDRLLAEIVLRPPDLRHLDAAIQSLGASARGETSLKASITDRYASRCATCDRAVILDEVTWASESTGEDGRATGPRPIRKHYRCPVCRDQLGGGEGRTAPVDPIDVERALDLEGAPIRVELRDRFPVLEGGDALADELLDLHTTRQLVALASILERVEGDLRAAPITAAMRLALLHAIAPASRLATSAGRVAPLRIAAGHVKVPSNAQWRERNPWLAFEDGVRLVRGFLQRLESGSWGPVPARLGDDLRSLAEGAATAVVKQGTPAALEALALEARAGSPPGIRPRVKLIIGTPPLRPVAERLSWAYHGTAWVLGREAASSLPLEPLFGPAVRPTWSWQAAAMTRALRAAEPVLGREARAVFLLEGEGPESLVACVLAGVSAGYRVAGARLPEAGRDSGGIVELLPPGSGNVARGARTRSGQALPPLPGGAGSAGWAPTDRLFGLPERVSTAPFSSEEAQRAVVDAAVDVLKLRGEPVSVEGLLGEILVGLDRTGHLRRLVRPPAVEGADAGREAEAAGLPTTAAGLPTTAAGLPTTAAGLPTTAADHVERLLGLVRAAIAGAEGRRLVRVGDDRWWLGDKADRELAAVPLADRVEWAVFSLLSTAGPLTEPAFLDRVTGLFAGPDLPDEALVRACLESYRGPAGATERLATADNLARRSEEHTRLIADLVNLGHRLGFSCWVGARQQPRRAGGWTLAEHLDQRELAGPPIIGRIAARHLEDVDVIWYVRGRVALAWEVEWTAMVSDTVLRRHARIPPDDRLIRFLVVLPERAELVRHKLERSPLLREALERGDWHVVKANHVRDWAARETVALADLEPLLGLDPPVERTGDQMALFGG